MKKQNWHGKLAFISLLFVGLCLMTSCSVGVGLGYGPVSVYFGVYADPALVSPGAKRFICYLQQSMERQGYQITELQSEHKIGFMAKRRLDPAELSQANYFHQVPGLVVSKIVSKDSHVHVTATLDLKALETADAQLNSSIHCKLQTDFKNAPLASNADQIGNQGKALEWSFNGGRVKPIEIDLAS